MFRYMNAAVLIFGLVLSSTGLAQKQAPPEGGQPKDFVLPMPRTFTLDNGLAVTLVTYGTVPKVTVQAVIRCGAIDETADQVWLSDLMGDMLKEGTTTRSAEELARQVAGMGGTLNVSVGADQMSVGGSILSEFGPDFVAVLADVVRNPRFPESELPRLINDRVRQLSIALTDPQSIVQQQFAKVIYPDHPYGRFFPTEAQLKGYTLGQVRSFYDANVGAVRTHVYVAGKFDEKKMEDAIRNGFNGWPRGADPVVNIPHPVSQRTIYLIDRPGAPQSTVMLGLPVIDPSNADYRALLVTDALLGGSFASRITSNIREEKGYTYSPQSLVSPHFRAATWAEFASVSTNVTGPSLKEIFYEINRLASAPPSPDELKGIQAYLSGIFVLRNSSPQGIINQLAFLDMHGLNDSYLKDFVKTVYSVTPERVSEITKEYLRPQDMIIVIAGDRKVIEKQVAAYGKIAK